MDSTIVFLTTGIIIGIFGWGIMTHHMTLSGKLVMFLVCYIGTCFIIASYTGQDFNSVLLAPLALLPPAQNQTLIVQAGNISVGNATATFQSGGATYSVVNQSVNPANISEVNLLNGTLMDPASPMNPMTMMMSVLLPFQSPWGVIIQSFIYIIIGYFIFSWMRRPQRDEYFSDYRSPPSSNTRSADPPQAQPPRAQQPPPSQTATGESAEPEEKKPEKRDRYEVIKV